MAPDGKHVYVANNAVSGSLSAFAVAADGSLTAVSGSSPGNATIADGHGVGTITDDDAAPPVLDTTPPDTTINSGPPKKTKKKQASFSFSSSEPGSSFECALDRASFAPCTSPKQVKAKKGKHSFSVRAKDAAGNIDQSPARYSWKVKKRRKRP